MIEWFRHTAVVSLCAGLLACGPGNTRADAGPAESPAARTIREQLAERSRRETRLDSFTLAADRGRALGDSAAPIWVVIVSDFQCAECAFWFQNVFPTIRREYVSTGRVRVAYVNMPLPSHLNGTVSALSAVCASSQGKFWETAERIVGTRDRWMDRPDARPFLDSLAIAAGANEKTQRLCTERARGLKLIRTDIDRSKVAAVDALPTFFVGARRLTGAVSLAAFRSAIETELAKK